jgi:hypothetical protein
LAIKFNNKFFIKFILDIFNILLFVIKIYNLQTISFVIFNHYFTGDNRELIYSFGNVLNQDPRIQDRLHNLFRSIGMGAPPAEEIEEGYQRLFPFGFYHKNVGQFWYPDYDNAPLKDARSIDDIENDEHWTDPDDPAYIEGGREKAKLNYLCMIRRV